MQRIRSALAGWVAVAGLVACGAEPHDDIPSSAVWSRSCGGTSPTSEAIVVVVDDSPELDYRPGAHPVNLRFVGGAFAGARFSGARVACALDVPR